MKIHTPFVRFLTCFLLATSRCLHATDFANGEMLAVPVKDGKPPVIDGKLDDWDMAAQEPIYISAATAEAMNAEWAVMYDENALYVSSHAAMPGRKYFNNSNPQDAFWSQDIAQIRLSSDPALSYPLNRDRDKDTDRILHISFWKNHETGIAFMDVAAGVRLNLKKVVNPEGSEIAMNINSDKEYILEARIPWSALNVPDGKNPFKAGESGVFFAESLWIGGDKSRTALNYNRNPGTFGFMTPDTWGKVSYVADSPVERIRPTMEELIEKAKKELAVEPAKVGVPVTVEIPGDGLKTSVNILDDKGGVVREIVGAQTYPKGKITVYWDGRDAFGKTLSPGEYRWASYSHSPLKAVYQGGVGSSGDPFYQTLDGKGGWGADHANPVDVAADDDSLYFLSPVSEAGKALVRTNYEGKVIWRKNPFVGGGFGPFYAVAANSKYVYLSRCQNVGSEGKTSGKLVRVLKENGGLTIWNDKEGVDEIEISLSPHRTMAANLIPNPQGAHGNLAGEDARQPDNVGLAADDERVFYGSYGADAIYVVDAETGKQLDKMDCEGVRGLTLDSNGDLFAVSFVPEKVSQVLKFTKARGKGSVVVSSGLEAPYDVAVDESGAIYVSDLGSSQQVKVFDKAGKAKAIGKSGGRPWQGKYRSEDVSFLVPSGIAIDGEGNLLVTESSPPKVFSRIRTADASVLNRWYGPGTYWNSTWAMPENPRDVFYSLSHALGRADLAGEGKVGVPNAYWHLENAGFPHAGDMGQNIPHPETIRAENDELYLVMDSGNHLISLLRDGVLRPVARWKYVLRDENGKHIERDEDRWVDVWIDNNADGQIQEQEKTRWDSFADGSSFPRLSDTTSGMHMESDGDLYFMTGNNAIIRVPATGFGKDGQIKWDIKAAHRAVQEVLPGEKFLHTTWRHGLLGTRIDGEGNIYTMFNAKLSGKGGKYDFADEESAKRMLEGMGHTSSFNAIKFAKFDPEGNLLWMAGRKATAGAKPGEMYHIWNTAGIVNDRYIAGGSEWGQIYFYTHDGFFVDALMNNPGEVADPGPYTFGGETSGGRVAYFSDSGEVWAYSLGMAYKVEGFKDGKVENESRSAGTVVLDKVYELENDEVAAAEPMQLVKISGDPVQDATVWTSVPVSALQRNGKPLAEVRIGYDDENFYGRIEVKDESPLENGATEAKMAFKGGDSAGIVLGSVRESGKVAAGDIRIMATQIDSKARLIAMKAFTKGTKQPAVYETPAAGRAEFEFVGEVPGGQVNLEEIEDGYIATFAVPRAFLELELKPDTDLRGDVEIRLSGAGQRGLQATSRNYLFTPSKSETTMVDDVPTESRMYPEYWGEILVK